MLIAVLAALMFFAMLAATFNAMRKEMSEARVVVKEPRPQRTSAEPDLRHASLVKPQTATI